MDVTNTVVVLGLTNSGALAVAGVLFLASRGWTIGALDVRFLADQRNSSAPALPV